MKALAHPARRRVLELLVYGPEYAGSLAASIASEFGISATRASEHLQVLAKASLVNVVPEETWRSYSLATEGFGCVREWLDLFRATSK